MKVKIKMYQVIPDLDGYYYILKFNVSECQYVPVEKHKDAANAQAKADDLNKEAEKYGTGHIIIDWDIQ